MSVCNLCYPLPETNSKKKKLKIVRTCPSCFFWGDQHLMYISICYFCRTCRRIFSERHDIHIFVSPNACCVFGLVSLNILRPFFEIAHHFWLVRPPVTTNQATNCSSKRCRPSWTDLRSIYWWREGGFIQIEGANSTHLPSAKSTRKMIVFVRSVQHWWKNWGPARLNPHIPNDLLFWMFCF